MTLRPLLSKTIWGDLNERKKRMEKKSVKHHQIKEYKILKVPT